ncbi:hypothetical protein CJF59_15160 (plasmid) [Acetobacter pomorum]|uniref:Uncharacterized protein n=2 Tax=Acetobacter pomorum TaxID=65959 RepID=A0AAN1UAI5_9PROT|nr:hypothetical protein CJF59_15160 [Acetobacter pomorum]
MMSFLVASSRAILSNKKESIMSKGIEKLRARTTKQHASCRAGKLYRWLFEHHETIRQARDDNIGWEEIAEAARADGITIVSDRPGRKLIQWKWKRVCLALGKLTSSKSDNDVSDRDAGRPIMPSRLPADWTPEFVDIPQPAPPSVQPVPQSSSLTLKTETVPAGAPMTMEQKIDKARFTLGQAKFDLTLAKEQIRRNDSQGAPMLIKEVEAKLPELREIIKQRRAIYDRLLAGEDVPEAELEFKSPREREEDQYSD